MERKSVFASWLEAVPPGGELYGQAQRQDRDRDVVRARHSEASSLTVGKTSGVGARAQYHDALPGLSFRRAAFTLVEIEGGDAGCVDLVVVPDIGVKVARHRDIIPETDLGAVLIIQANGLMGLAVRPLIERLRRVSRSSYRRRDFVAKRSV